MTQENFDYFVGLVEKTVDFISEKFTKTTRKSDVSLILNNSPDDSQIIEQKEMLENYMKYHTMITDVITEFTKYDSNLTDEFYIKFYDSKTENANFPPVLEDFFDFVEALRAERYEDCAILKEKIINLY